MKKNAFLPTKKIFILLFLFIGSKQSNAFVDQLLIPPGEELLSAHEWGVQVSYDLISGVSFVGEVLVPVVSYNWSNKIGAMIVFPYFLKIQNGAFKSSGIGDVGLIGNLELYHYENYSILGQGGLFFPAGSLTKQPNTGYGGYSPFLSINSYLIQKKWFTQTVSTLLIPGKGQGIHFGPQFLFNVASGPTLTTSRGSNFYFLGEFVFLTIQQPTRTMQAVNTNTNFLVLTNVGDLAGVTALFLGGSFTWQKEKALVEFLVQAPVSQMLLENQPRYLLNVTLSASLAF